MLWFSCGVLKVHFVNEVCFYTGKWFVLGTLWVENRSILNASLTHVLLRIYTWMHLCVCMRMHMCVFEGVCLYLSVTVYTLSAWGHLDWVCVVLSGESTHMCLHEDLVLCGCVFDKLWEHVGDCLSIHLGESKRERAEWGGGGDLLPASIFKSICSQTSLSLP